MGDERGGGEETVVGCEGESRGGCGIRPVGLIQSLDLKDMGLQESHVGAQLLDVLLLVNVVLLLASLLLLLLLVLLVPHVILSGLVE